MGLAPNGKTRDTPPCVTVTIRILYKLRLGLLDAKLDGMTNWTLFYFNQSSKNLDTVVIQS